MTCPSEGSLDIIKFQASASTSPLLVGFFFCSTPFSHELRRRWHRLTDHFPYCFSAGCWQRRFPRDPKAEHQKLWRAHWRRSRQHVSLIREPWVCCRQTTCLHHQSYGNFPRFQMISTPGTSVGRPACLNIPLLRRSDEDGCWIDFHAAWALKAVGWWHSRHRICCGADLRHSGSRGDNERQVLDREDCQAKGCWYIHPDRKGRTMAENLEERFERRAYEIWERDGRPEGKREEHWAQACQEIAAETGIKTDCTSRPVAFGAEDAENVSDGKRSAQVRVGGSRRHARCSASSLGQEQTRVRTNPSRRVIRPLTDHASSELKRRSGNGRLGAIGTRGIKQEWFLMPSAEPVTSDTSKLQGSTRLGPTPWLRPSGDEAHDCGPLGRLGED